MKKKFSWTPMKAGKNNQHELEIERIDTTDKCEQVIVCYHCFREIKLKDVLEIL